MLEKHTTSEGRSMLIAQMDDAHLSNMIKLLLRRIIELRDGATGGTELSEYEAQLYGITRIDQGRAAELNRMAFKKLYPYLSEALLRGKNLEEIQLLLRRAAGRDGVLWLPVVHQLASGIDDEYDESITIDTDDPAYLW